MSTTQPEALRENYTAADMATASAQGFRDGVASVAAGAGSEPVAQLASERDELFQAAIDFIRTLTGMEPPPIEVAPPDVFAPFHAFVNTVQAITNKRYRPPLGGVARPCHVFNVRKIGSRTEWTPTTMALALPDGEHALYTHPSPPEGMVGGWMPIETAPKDGTYLLLWEQYSTNPFVGCWAFGAWRVSHEHVDAEGGWDGAIVVDSISQDRITHWMPMPPAPSSDKGVAHG